MACQQVKLIAILLLVAAALPAQTFEVAAIRRSAQQSSTGMILVRSGQPEEPGRIAWTSVSLKALIEMAYHVDMDQVGGPQWIDDERYDINAKYPPDTPRDEMRIMVRNMLADRFHLTFHEETRPRLEYDWW